MRFGIILASMLLCFTGLQGQSAAAKQTANPTPPAGTKHKHPHLHHALWALHHAHHELKTSPEHFGGHKEKAEHEIHAAIKQIEVLLKHENDSPQGIPSKGQLTEAHKQYKHHPHLHHALNEVKSAHHQLKESKEHFGGHKEKALHDMHKAIHQIELVLKHANQADKSTKTTKTTK
jgi:hypothetical protein